MIAALAKVFTAVAGRLFFSFFTERVVSRLIIELMRLLAKKTSNTIDDTLVEEVVSNMKI